jgi:hypothetical protein
MKPSYWEETLMELQLPLMVGRIVLLFLSFGLVMQRLIRQETL